MRFLPLVILVGSLRGGGGRNVQGTSPNGQIIPIPSGEMNAQGALRTALTAPKSADRPQGDISALKSTSTMARRKKYRSATAAAQARAARKEALIRRAVARIASKKGRTRRDDSVPEKSVMEQAEPRRAIFEEYARLLCSLEGCQTVNSETKLCAQQSMCQRCPQLPQPNTEGSHNDLLESSRDTCFAAKWFKLPYAKYEGHYPLAMLAVATGIPLSSGGLALEWDNQGPLRADLCRVQKDKDDKAYIDYYLDLLVRTRSSELRVELNGGLSRDVSKRDNRLGSPCDKEGLNSGVHVIDASAAVMGRLTEQIYLEEKRSSEDDLEYSKRHLPRERDFSVTLSCFGKNRKPKPCTPNEMIICARITCPTDLDKKRLFSDRQMWGLTTKALRERDFALKLLSVPSPDETNDVFSI